MIILFQIVLTALVLRAMFQVGLGVCQVAAGLTAGILATVLYGAATLLHWLVLLWTTAFPKEK